MYFYIQMCVEERLSTDDGDDDANNDNDIRRTIQDYISPLALMPNEPTRQK